MGLDQDNSDGKTLLDEEEHDGILIPSISTRGELDEFEQQNIEEAIQWTLGQTFRVEEIFSEKFLRDLHKRMYGNVWKWAGKFRKTEKNIGIDWWKIPVRLKELLDDVQHWYDHKTYSPDEIAIRFKHRLVSIHCFPNGNGRHSRLMADMIAEKIFRRPIFTWGTSYQNTGEARKAYINALKAADKGDYNLLVTFARS